jgi:hypothetical protein
MSIMSRRPTFRAQLQKVSDRGSGCKTYVINEADPMSHYLAVSKVVVSKVATVSVMVGGGSALMISSVAIAQVPDQPSNAASSASLLGVQERSVQTGISQTPPANVAPSQAIGSKAAPLPFYQLDNKTRVILAPVRSTRSNDPMEIPVAGSRGDNRLQLQHDVKP